MLYEMVTGKKPFPGKMNPETLARIHKGKYTAPRKINPTLPSSLNWFMKHCIQAKPQKRADSVAVLLKRLEKWYQSADTDRIREDLIRIVNDEERLPGKAPRRRAGFKIYLAAAAAVIIAGGGSWFYLNEMHLKTIYAARNGGLRLVSTLKEADLYKPADRIHMEAVIFNDEEGRIGNDKLKSFFLRSGKGGEEGLVSLESPLIHLPPGAYWIKTMYDDAVWWQNVSLPPYTDGSFLLKPGEETRLVLKLPVPEPKPLRISIDAHDRHDGSSLNEGLEVSVQPGGKKDYIPLEEIRNELITGNSYNFRVEAEGYYPMVYDLGIKAHQDLLVLEPEMIPREGWIRLKSSEELPENLEIRIDGSSLLPAAGISSLRLPASELGKLTRTALPPGEYELELKSGKAVQTFQTTVVREEETLLVIEIKRDRKNISEMLIKAIRP
jgi:serine/threonine-protein kinase